MQEVPERYISTSIRGQHTEHVFYEVRVWFYCKSLSKFFLLEEKKKQHRKLKTVIAFFSLVYCISYNEVDLKLYKRVFCEELMKEV